MSNKDLPPWLMDDDDEQESSSSIKPIQPINQPPPSQSDPNAPAPWLSGLDFEDPNEQKEIVKGGKLSADFLASGDQLIDKVESELTYDEWLARQQEAKREKSIEEEVPEFLDTSDILEAAPSPDLPQTGQLPDWFLGLEKLEDDEPDWMKSADKFTSDEVAKAAPPQPDVPNWMDESDKFAAGLPAFSGFDDEDDAPKSSPASVDESIDSFFASLSQGTSTSDDGEELPNLDAMFLSLNEEDESTSAKFEDAWDNTPAAPASSSGTSKSDGVTAQLPPLEQEEPLSPQSDEELFFSDFGDDAPAPNQQAAAVLDEIPDRDQDTLDALFAELIEKGANESVDLSSPAAVPASATSTEDLDALIEEGPDESWFVDDDPDHIRPPANPIIVPGDDEFDDEPEPIMYSGDDDDEQYDNRTFNTGTLNELDDFFGSVAAQRDVSEPKRKTPEESIPDVIEDPDIEWFLNAPTPPMTGELPSLETRESPAPQAAPTPTEPTNYDDSTLSWLNEVTNIVSRITQGEAEQDESFVDEGDASNFFDAPAPSIPPPPAFEDFGITPDDDDTGTLSGGSGAQRGAADDNDPFAWPDQDTYVEPEPAPASEGANEDSTGLSWLSSVDASAAEFPAEPAPEEPLIPRVAEVTPNEVPRKSLLTGMLRASDPQPEAEESLPSDDGTPDFFSNSYSYTPPPTESGASAGDAELPDDFTFDFEQPEVELPSPASGDDVLDAAWMTESLLEEPLYDDAPPQPTMGAQSMFAGDEAPLQNVGTEFNAQASFDDEPELAFNAQPSFDDEPELAFDAQPSFEDNEPVFDTGGLKFEDEKTFDTSGLKFDEEPAFDTGGLKFDDERAFNPSFDTPENAGKSTGESMRDENDLFRLTDEIPDYDDSSAEPETPDADDEPIELEAPSLDFLMGDSEAASGDVPPLEPQTPQDSDDLSWLNEVPEIPTPAEEPRLPDTSPLPMRADFADDIRTATGSTDELKEQAAQAEKDAQNAFAQFTPSANEAEGSEFEMPSFDDDMSFEQPMLESQGDQPQIAEFDEEAFFDALEDEAASEQIEAAAEANELDTSALTANAGGGDNFFAAFDDASDETASLGGASSGTGSGTPSGDDDFFSALGVQDESAPENGDFFGALGVDEPKSNADDDDFFAALGIESDQPAAQSSGGDDDFFGALAADASANVQTGSSTSDDDSSFFDELNAEPDHDEMPPIHPAEDGTGEFFKSMDFDFESDTPAPQSGGSDETGKLNFDELFGGAAHGDAPPVDDEKEAFAAAPAEAASPAFTDIESYLASLNTDTPDIQPAAAAAFTQTDVDIESLFNEGLSALNQPREATPSDMQQTLSPDWLSEVQASVGEVSASALVRQRKDKPEAELPDRLKKLRQREKAVEKAQEKASEPPKRRGKRATDEHAAAEADALSTVLPGAPALAPAAIKPGALTLAQSVVLSPAQQTKVDLLKSLAQTSAPSATQGSNRLSAIDLTYDTPYLPGLEDDPNIILDAPRTDASKPSAKPAATRKRARRRMKVRVDRLLIALFLILVVAAPFFVAELRLGEPPPASLIENPRGAAVFTAMESIQRDDYVLFAIEYSPASAGELDPMTESLLRHAILRGARPVIISTNPFGVLRAGNMIARINTDERFLNRIDQPDATLIANLDYYLIRYLSGGAIGLRSFSEQPGTVLALDIEGQPTLLQARSLADFALVTLITDNSEDIRTYAEQLAPMLSAPMLIAAGYAAAPSAEVYGADGVLVGFADALTYENLLPGIGALERGERQPTPTPTIPAPAGDTQTGGADATEAAPGTGLMGVIIAETTVNVRSGPGTNFGVIAAATPDQQIEVLGFSDDSAWVNVRFEDGSEGWVSQQFVRINPPEQSRDTGKFGRAKQADDPTPRPSRTPRPADAEATVDATEDETAVTGTPEATAEAGGALPEITLPQITLPTFTFDAELDAEDYREGRWYALNLGIVASAAVIALGAVINIVRGLLRRRQRD